MNLDCSAVLDIGKTHVKLCVFDNAGSEVERLGCDNRPLASPQGYAALDTPDIAAWLVDSLAALRYRARLGHLITTTHGSAFAAIDDRGLVLPMIDYEFDAYGPQREAYAAGVGDLRETLSPHLPAGLNAGRQWYWQSREFPGEFARAHWLLPYPQYWAWWLSGVAASEVSSLGCHTHLWSPSQRGWSRLALTEGWAARFAPLRHSGDVLGALRPELAERLGLNAGCVVHTGVHDSNACLARHLRRCPQMTLVTSGTWTIVMACGGAVETLDLTQDMLANVSVMQDPVPTARFMGGRDHELLLGDAAPADASLGMIPELFRSQTFALPRADGGGVTVWQGEREITNALGQALTRSERATLAALYCALMTARLIERLQAPPPIVIEGPLAHNNVFLNALQGLLPEHGEFQVSIDVEGTARGAWLLTRWGEPWREDASVSSLGPMPPVAGLSHYHVEWTARVERQINDHQLQRRSVNDMNA